MPDWFRDMLFVSIGILVSCGVIMALIITIAIVKAIIDDRKKR